MGKRYKAAEQNYEASGKRPGTPVGTRLSDGVLKLLDARLEAKQSRSAWLQALVHRELGVNEQPKKKARKPR